MSKLYEAVSKAIDEGIKKEKYADLEDTIKNEIIAAMQRAEEDYTDYEAVEEFSMNNSVSKAIIDYEDETGEELMFWTEPVGDNDFRVVVQPC